jgi:predicted RNase H-like HicB family nuclease
MTWYVARIANHDGVHAATFPDAPPVCVSAATLEDVVERAAQALTWHLDDLRAKGIPCPRPTPLAAFHGAGDSPGAIYALVEIADTLEAAAAGPLTHEPLQRAPVALLQRAAKT